MLKLILVFFGFSFFSLAFADVKFDEIIKNNIIEENIIASEVQQFAGVQAEVQKNPKAKELRKESDFKVVLRKKSEKKNPVVQRSIASKNRVTKKQKRKN